MNTFLQYTLPIYLILFFGAAFLWRSYRVWKTTGLNPYTLGNTDTAHDLIGRLFRITLLACFLVVGLYSLSDTAYQLLLPISWLQHPALIVLGLILLSISFVWIVIAQAQMGNAWRIGIDAAHTTELVQSGLFRLSRNPIFLGMRVMLLGLLLVLPNAATFAIWLLGDVLMQIQVRLEEEHLTKLHGENYRVYCQRVRRWI